MIVNSCIDGSIAPDLGRRMRGVEVGIVYILNKLCEVDFANEKLT
jgi:hypothetical protein